MYWNTLFPNTLLNKTKRLIDLPDRVGASNLSIHGLLIEPDTKYIQFQLMRHKNVGALSAKTLGHAHKMTLNV